MDGTILSIGNFTQPATAAIQTIAVPSDLDFLKIYNYTQFAANAGANADSLYWQRGMGTIGTYTGEAGGVAVVGITAANAFSLHNPNEQNFQSVGAAIAITDIDAATGIVLTATTTGLSVGSVIRLSTMSLAAAQQLGGIDFTVSAINAGVSFTITGYNGSTIPVAPTAAINATTGFYRIVGDPLFVPRQRVISNVTAAANALVSTTSPHGFAIGQKVRFVVPAISATQYGMTQLEGLSGVVLSITSTTAFTIDVDSSGFSAFAFPAAASVPFSPALVVPYGDDTATALIQAPPLSSLEDSVLNSGFIGMELAIGALLPGGVALDVIYWQAGKASFGGL